MHEDIFMNRSDIRQKGAARHREDFWRWLKQHFGFDAASAVRLKYILSPKKLSNAALYSMYRNRHPLRVPYYPLTLMVEISTLCNLKCPGCERLLFQTNPSCGGLPQANASLANLKKLAPVLPYIYSTYFVSGLGEPFLNPEFWDIHHFFKSFGMKTGYFTNASLLTEERIDRTFAERVDSVLISIDSYKRERFEAIKTGATFDKTLSGIKLFARKKREMGRRDFELGLNFIFRSDNYGEILDYLDFAKSLKVDFINASAFIVHIQKEMDKSLCLVPAQVKRDLFDQAALKAKRLGIRLRLPRIEPTTGCLCYHLWHGACIFYNGDVCACPFFRTPRPFYFHADDQHIVCEERHYEDTVLGNYLRQDFFNDIWNGSRARQLRRAEVSRQRDFNPCGMCYYKYELH